LDASAFGQDQIASYFEIGTMPQSDFEAKILEDEVVIAHVGEGHVYHFPILSNGTVSLHGSRMEPNPDAKREASRYLFDAHDAARSAFSRSHA
jgi:hypothetical protein